jgi:methylated-DNA-[protein]-cysteine S-methyltransferase
MKANIKQLFYGMLSQTPLGAIFVAVSEKGLVAVQIGGEEENFTLRLSSRFGVPLTPSEVQVLPVIHQIEAYLQETRKSFDLPIHWDVMSPFQQKVQRAVYAIPYGETRTYGQIAAQIGSPRAARAVGRANATNPMPLVLPCHRLVGADGSLRGYGGGEGIKTKAWLLDLEKKAAQTS